MPRHRGRIHCGQGLARRRMRIWTRFSRNTAWPAIKATPPRNSPRPWRSWTTPLHRLSFEPVRERSLFPVDLYPWAGAQMDLSRESHIGDAEAIRRKCRRCAPPSLVSCGAVTDLHRILPGTGDVFGDLPWSDFWERSLFSAMAPQWRVYWDNAYLRGAVSGLGIVNVYISLAEIFRLRRFARR